MAKYDALRRHLLARSGDLHVMEFDDIAGLVGGLPPSASRYLEWWSNHDGRHVQAHAWLAAGWRVDHVDLRQRRVKFRKTSS